jgi:hypothetical protein
MYPLNRERENMKKLIWLFVSAGLIFALACMAQKPVDKAYFKMSAEEIDQDIRATVKQPFTNQQKMEYYSERFLGAPYELECEAEGEHGLYEKWPLMNLKQVNCMTYCEIVMALTLSEYYEEMFNVLQHIRYRQGIIGMASRNHYTMADWLPANRWCLDDVTRQVGGTDALPLTRTISHQTFFGKKRIQNLPVFLPDREVTIDYIPLDKLRLHEDSLKSGDVVALIQDRPAIFSAHMLLVIKKDSLTFFRHASMSAGKVLDVPFGEYIQSLQKNPRYQGMSFMRIKEEIQWQDGNYTHGKFILPQE